MKYFVIFLGFSCSPLFGQKFYNAQAPKMNANQEGVFMQGYDPISYFDGSPQKGAVDFEYVHKNTTFQFANQKNLDRFISSPSQYLPRYGGWCAIGVCFEVVDSNYPSGKYKVDPLNYEVYQGKLYFFYPENEFAAKNLWSRKKEFYISKADSLWLRIKK